MPTVIGLDFGNCFSFPSFVDGIDESTRTGGTEYDLIPVQYGRTQEGIPSRFFYQAGEAEPIVGLKVEQRRIPRSQYKVLLKRHLRESFEMGGRHFTYREAARLVIEDCIRKANRRLEEISQETTNLIALAYPADYLASDRQLLVKTVEQATLEDGTPLKVVGTIREPAAAALEYLAGELPTRNDPMTVLVYDLGGGTFDATILTCYPRGIENAAGKIRYYDEHVCNGLKGVGGEDFSRDMADLLRESVQNVTPEEWDDPLFLGFFAEETETAKHVLSDEDSYMPRVGMHWCNAITREQFEERTRPRLMQTIELTLSMLQENATWRPEKIVLTGGASRMPMVRRTLLEELQARNMGYRAEDIILYQPSRAISYGAARYGIPESGSGHIIQRTRRDLGIRYIERYDRRSYVGVHIPAGTEIPYEFAKFSKSVTSKPGLLESRYQVFEATVDHPDRFALDTDWKLLGEIRLSHGGAALEGTACEERLIIDDTGTLRVEARRSDDPLSSIVRTDLEWEFDQEDEDA